MIDAWLAYEQVEPAAFEERTAESGEQEANRGGPGSRMIDAREAAKRLAGRLRK